MEWNQTVETFIEEIDPGPSTVQRTLLYTLFAMAGSVILMTRETGPGLNKEFPFQFRLMAKLRTPLLLYFVIPLSFLRWVYRKTLVLLRDFILEMMSFFGIAETKQEAIDAAHEERVKRVQEQIRKWNDEGRRKKLRTSRPNWAAMSTKLSSNKGDSEKIKTTDMNHILKIDEEKMTVTCEPSVTMGMLTDALVPKNLALEVQVEMESITAGGIAFGFGMETNSHRSGLTQETIVQYEIVTSDAEVIKVTKDSDPELFHALPWSQGSIGFLTSLELKLVKIKPYVRVKYIPTYDKKSMETQLADLAERTNEELDKEGPFFLEATLYSEDEGVIQVADFCDYDSSDPYQKKIYNPINYFWKPYYYKHVQTFLEKGRDKANKEPMEDIIPIKHFYHRFTRSVFWEIEEMIPFANNILYRLLWGWMGAPEVSLLKLFQGPVIRKASIYAHVVQESIMPIRRLAEGVEKFDKWYGVYPLLVFPIRIYDRSNTDLKDKKGLGTFLSPKKENLLPGRDYGMWVDLGAYGVPRAARQGKMWDAKSSIRAMEEWNREIGAWSVTYTDNFATRKEFRQMFDHTLYDKVRKKYNCIDAFPEVYDKVKSEPGLIDLSEEEAKGL